VFIGYGVTCAIYSTQNTALISLRRGGLYLVQNIILGLRAPLLFLFVSLGVLGIFMSFDIAFLATFLFGAVVLYRFSFSIKSTFDTTPLREIFRFSLGNYTADILSIGPVSIIPIIIVNTVGPQAGAYYYIASAVAELLFTVPTAVSMSLFVEGSHEMPLRENVMKSLKFTMLLLIPAVAFIFLFGDKVLLLFGQQYSEHSFDLLRLLAVSSLLSVVPLIYLSIKNIQKHLKIYISTHFAISALILGAGYLSLLKYGVIGLGYAWLVSYALVFVAVGWLVMRRERWL
jgi:O-antigen/teichoic acid export membrane protein